MLRPPRLRLLLAVLPVLILLLATQRAVAHFQMVIPSADCVSASGQRDVQITLLFNHPMEGELMNMARPSRFGVAIRGEKIQDLTSTLKEKVIGKHSTWTTTYSIKRPGDHIFVVEPQPYWEPAEDKLIIHYTKVIVSALGMEVGWDKELGLKTEIVPLVRPYGLWAGNLFRGIAKKDGKPIPFARIEVEYYNAPGPPAVKAPTGAHVTQVIKADQNGVFAYAMPRAGWWGFAALSDADFRLKGKDGKDHDVEFGALIWVKTTTMK